MSVGKPRVKPRIVNCYYCESVIEEPNTRTAKCKNSDVKFDCGKCRIKPKRKVKLIKDKPCPQV